MKNIFCKNICILGLSVFFAHGTFALDSYAYLDTKNSKVLNSFGLSHDFMSEPIDKVKDIKGAWRYFSTRFDQGGDFIPMIRNLIAQENLPQEFLFVAMVESEFKIEARSSKKASGIWQFMPGTAKIMGLEISDYIDERHDPVKSTKAAIEYLKFLYEKTGEWYLAVMAYNCGWGRLNRAIQAAGGARDLVTLLDPEKEYLPLETRNYIRKIVAMSLVFNDVDFVKNSDLEHLLNRGAADTLATLRLKSGIPLSAVAKAAGLSLKEVQRLNKHFKYAFLPPGPKDKVYNVYLPYDKLARFKQNFDEKKHINTAFHTHKVQKGETLSSIARKYKTSIAELQSLNGLKNSLLKTNQKIVIPIKRS